MKLIHYRILIFGALAGVFAVSCSPRQFKPTALNLSLFEETEAYHDLISRGEPADVFVNPGIEWLADTVPSDSLVFLAYRTSQGTEPQYAALLKIELETRELLVQPLDIDEDPLSVIQDDERSRELMALVKESAAAPVIQSGHAESGAAPARLSFDQIVSEQLLAPPLPTPRRIFATAANYLSHLQHDLGIENVSLYRSVLQRARPRLFIKYPPFPPPVGSGGIAEMSGPMDQLLGPFDTVLFPSRVIIPGAADSSAETDARLDYEVEIGVVIGRDLTWDEVKEADDAELQQAVAGYVLVGDTKFRNPQAMNAILNYGGLPEEANPYRIGHLELDRRLGVWNERACAWWSYAASWGQFTSVGPFFVAAAPGKDQNGRMVMSARSYGDPESRLYAPPEEVEIGKLYVRQASSGRGSRAEVPIWSVPQLIRSILAPHGALNFGGSEPTIHRGDIIALGTPGGTVITAKSSPLINLLRKVLFWWEPKDWHDAFFGRSAEQYLYEGDEVFYWAEGLGFQQLFFKAFGGIEALIESPAAGAGSSPPAQPASDPDSEPIRARRTSIS